MIVDLYLNYNKKRERTSILDCFCLVHFLFGYLLYKLNFPIFFTICIDIFSQFFIRTETGEKIIKKILGDKDIKDDNLSYRYCDTFFIVIGWFTAYLINKK
jgi:hypothetical protein